MVNSYPYILGWIVSKLPLGIWRINWEPAPATSSAPVSRFLAKITQIRNSQGFSFQILHE